MDIIQEHIDILRAHLATLERIHGPVRRYRAGRNCQRGYNCGGSCITRRKNCRKALQGEAKNFSEWMVQKMSANIGAVVGEAPVDKPKTNYYDTDIFDNISVQHGGDAGLASAYLKRYVPQKIQNGQIIDSDLKDAVKNSTTRLDPRDTAAITDEVKARLEERGVKVVPHPRAYYDSLNQKRRELQAEQINNGVDNSAQIAEIQRQMREESQRIREQSGRPDLAATGTPIDLKVSPPVKPPEPDVTPANPPTEVKTPSQIRAEKKAEREKQARVKEQIEEWEQQQSNRSRRNDDKSAAIGGAIDGYTVKSQSLSVSLSDGSKVKSRFDVIGDKQAAIKIDKKMPFPYEVQLMAGDEPRALGSLPSGFKSRQQAQKAAVEIAKAGLDGNKIANMTPAQKARAAKRIEKILKKYQDT